MRLRGLLAAALAISGARLAGALVNVACLGGCTPSTVAPVPIDATMDGGCSTLDAITSDRLIRTANGTPLVIHCPEGGSP